MTGISIAAAVVAFPGSNVCAGNGGAMRDAAISDGPHVYGAFADPLPVQTVAIAGVNDTGGNGPMWTVLFEFDPA